MRDLIDREVSGVDVGLQLWLERCADLAQRVPVDTIEEWVLLELGGATITSKTVLWVANKAVVLCQLAAVERNATNSPSNKVLRLCRQRMVWREV